MVLETAALELAAGVLGTDRLQGMSSHVMFLARGKAGPFRAEGEALVGVGGSDGTAAVRVLLIDEGAHDRMITAGSYAFRVVE